MWVLVLVIRPCDWLQACVQSSVHIVIDHAKHLDFRCENNSTLGVLIEEIRGYEQLKTALSYATCLCFSLT